MNPENSKLLEVCFRNAKSFGDLSASSILKYRDSLKKFFNTIGDISFEKLTKVDFQDFIIQMQENGASNSRIANVISAVKWALNKMQGEGMIERVLDLDTIKKPKIGQKEQSYLTEEEIEMFVNGIKKDKEKNGEIIRIVRFMALIQLLLQTGCRIGEALSINLKDINWQNGEIKIVGKGSKPRTLTIRDNTKVWLKKYLSRRQSHNEALFVALNGKNRWRQTDAGRSFRRYRSMSGIKKEFTLHTFRRTLATLLFHQGVGADKVQLIMGHSRLETTVRYYLKSAQDKVVKEIMMKDEYFNFIPQIAVKNQSKKNATAYL